jgi:flagellar biosynthetic protein FliR
MTPAQSALLFLFLASWARSAGLLVFLPLGLVASLPSLGLAALTVSVALLATFAAPGLPPPPDSLLAAAQALGANLLVGLALGTMALLVWSAWQVAGGILDMALGFSFTATLGLTEAAQPWLTRLFSLLGSVLFLTLGGLADLVGVVVASLRLWPPTTPWTWTTALPSGLWQAFSQAFLLAVMAVAPVLLAVTLVNVLAGALGRLVPQVNLLAVDFPLLMALGVVLVAVSLPVWLGVSQDFLGQLGSAAAGLWSGLLPRKGGG